jgi:hypothetical protein
MLRGVDWYLDTYVSGQAIGPIFKGEAFQVVQAELELLDSLKEGPIACQETSLANYQSTLRYIPEDAHYIVPVIKSKVPTSFA